MLARLLSEHPVDLWLATADAAQRNNRSCRRGLPGGRFPSALHKSFNQPVLLYLIFFMKAHAHRRVTSRAPGTLGKSTRMEGGEGTKKERASLANLESVQRALIEQEHHPWEEATRKTAAGRTPVQSESWGPQPDDTTLDPPDREKRSKRTHDPARQPKTDARADDVPHTRASAANAAKGPEVAPEALEATPEAEVLPPGTESLGDKADDVGEPTTKVGGGAPEVEVPAPKEPRQTDSSRETAEASFREPGPSLRWCAARQQPDLAPALGPSG